MVTAWIDKRIEHLGVTMANRLLEALLPSLSAATASILPPTPTPPDSPKPGTPRLKAVD